MKTNTKLKIAVVVIVMIIPLIDSFYLLWTSRAGNVTPLMLFYCNTAVLIFVVLCFVLVQLLDKGAKEAADYEYRNIYNDRN